MVLRKSIRKTLNKIRRHSGVYLSRLLLSEVLLLKSHKANYAARVCLPEPSPLVVLTIH